MQEEVLQTYKQFYSLIRAEYDFEISNTLLTPSAISDRLQKLSGRTETTALSKKG